MTMVPSRSAVLADLMGPDHQHSRHMVGLSTVLFFIVVGVTMGVKFLKMAPGIFIHPTSPSTVLITIATVIVGMFFAASSARSGGGLFPSWSLVLAPFSAWLLIYHYDSTNPLLTFGTVVTLSILTVPIFGTFAHATGRLIRFQHTGETWENTTGPVFRFLMGSSPRRVGAWALLGGFFLTIAIWNSWTGWLPKILLFPVWAIAMSRVFGTIVTLAWVGVAALPGYRYEGMISSWLLIFAPLWPMLVMGTSGYLARPLLVEAARNGITGLIVAIPVGTVGFLIGLTFRRIMQSRRNTRGSRDVASTGISEP